MIEWIRERLRFVVGLFQFLRNPTDVSRSIERDISSRSRDSDSDSDSDDEADQ